MGFALFRTKGDLFTWTAFALTGAYYGDRRMAFRIGQDHLGLVHDRVERSAPRRNLVVNRRWDV
jgi:hypothetical protein